MERKTSSTTANTSVAFNLTNIVMEIKITYGGLKVKHLKPLMDLKAEESTKGMVDVVSNVCGVSRDLLYRIEYKELINLYQLIVKDLNEASMIKDLPLKETIEVDGVKYRFIEEAKQTVGWYIDASNLSITPEVLMSLYYIEAEAKNYSELDERGFQKYDTLERAEKLGNAPISYYIMLANYLKKKATMLETLRTTILSIEAMILEAGFLRYARLRDTQTSHFTRFWKCLTKHLKR